MSTTNDLDAQISPVITKAMHEMRVLGALVHVRVGRQPPLHQAYGNRRLDSTDAMTLNDYVRIGSNTKTMTATVVLKLVDQKKLGLDDRLNAFRPDVPDGAGIKIRDLLDMRSGLENYSTRHDVNASLDQEPSRVWEPEELIRLGIELPPSGPPQSGFSYSNTNTVLLGRIAEGLTNKPLAQLFQEWIFAPLGLQTTSLPAGEHAAAIPDPHPRGYMYLSNLETLGSPAIPPDLRVQADGWRLLPGDRTDDNTSWTWAAGGAISTLGDLVTYVEALVKGGLLSDELQSQRLASLTSTNPSCSDAPSYGWGLAKFGPYIGHDGTLPGFQSFMGHDPLKDSTVVVVTNLTYAPDGRETANAIVMAIMAALSS